MVLKNFYTVQPNSNNKYFTRFKFVGKINRDIKKKFRDTFYNNNTLSKLINNKIYTKNALDKSGVYEIQCDNCEYKYIGQTGRSFLIRFNEHMRSWKNKKSDSNLAIHLLENNHNCSIKNLKILHVEKKGSKLNFLEAFEIDKAIKRNEKLMNDQTDILHSKILKILSKRNFS